MVFYLIYRMVDIVTIYIIYYEYYTVTAHTSDILILLTTKYKQL